MTDRRSHDKPAALIAAALGVALIVVGLPMAISHFPEAAQPDSFSVLWSEVAVGSQSATVTEGQTQGVDLRAEDLLTSRIRVVPGDCTDSTNSPLAGPAVLTYRLVRRTSSGEERLKEGSVGCANKGDAQFTYDRIQRPDIGSVDAASAAEAMAKVWAAAPVNETATYRLEVTASRQAGAGGPLPNPIAPTLSATFSLEVDRWAAAVVAQEPEVTVR